MITAEQVREYFYYDPITGDMFWKKNTRNKNRIGVKLFSKTGAGYLRVVWNKENYTVHRLAWLYCYGKWPTGQVDHIDGNRTNNALSNLRDVPQNLNMQNQRACNRDSTTGLLGVYLTKKKKSKSRPYRAQIRKDGVSIHIGSYYTKEEAHAAYVAKKREIHPGGML